MIYKKIKEKFEEQLRTIDEVKSVDWYNEQYLHTDKEQVEKYPAAYIEILDPVNWTTAGDKMQHGKMNVKIHVVIDTLSANPEPVMELCQKVSLKINNKAFNEGDQYISSAWLRTSTDIPKRYRKLKVMKVTFTAEVYDRTLIDVLQDVEDIQFNIPTILPASN